MDCWFCRKVAFAEKAVTQRVVAEKTSFSHDKEAVGARMGSGKICRFWTDIYLAEIYCSNTNVIATDFSVNFYTFSRSKSEISR